MKTNERVKHDFFSQYGIPIFFTAGLILLTLITNYFFKTEHLLIWILSLLFIVLLSLFFVVFFFKHLKSITVDVLEDLKVELQKNLDKNLIDWLKTQEQLQVIEKSKNTLEVWIVSMDLKDDVENGFFMNTIKDNIERGVKYKYFVPEQDYGATLVLFDCFASDSYKEKLEFGSLPKEYFIFMPKLDFVIYNPRETIHAKRSGFMSLPHTIDNKILYQEITHYSFLRTITASLQEITTKKYDR